MNTSDRRWLIAALLFFAFMVAVTLSADIRWIPTQIQGIPFFDKLGHLSLYGFLALLLHRALRGRAVRMGPLSIPLALVIVCTLGILDEAQQSLSPYRSVDIQDLSADWFGAVLGITLLSVLPIWQRLASRLQFQ